MIRRESYMKELMELIDKPFVKVLTGLRRSGKSAILLMLQEELLALGKTKDQIIYVNFENMDYADIETGKQLHDYLQGEMREKAKRYYIFLDEIQEVAGWEKVVNSLMATSNVDLYLTGSNSNLLSSELATYLAGRYVEIPVFTLSFKEFLLFSEIRTGVKATDFYKKLNDFIRLGGFPAIHINEYETDTAYKIIKDIYSSAILRDTVQRYGIRNIELLERIVKFVFDNVGSTFSAKRVADYFKSQQRKVDLNTVYHYLNALESAFIIRRVSRYDVQGRGILQTNEKYYLGDQSLKYALMGYKDRAISGVLENIVMLELSRRGYAVYVGKVGEKEIDFIAERGAEKIYVQVAYLMGDAEETIHREFSPLLSIKDNYPKYVVTMDDFWKDNVEGVKHKHLADFLLMDKWD